MDMLEELTAKYAAAPKGEWFTIDDRCYLHYRPEGEQIVDPKPWDYPVVGRFDYGRGAMDFVKDVHNNFPELIRLARAGRDGERDKARLDWLEANKRCTYRVGYPEGDATKWAIDKTDALPNHSLRCAIDAAMFASGATKEPK